MDDFEQDWADVTGGNYTMDEIAAGDDILPAYEYNPETDDWAAWDTAANDSSKKTIQSWLKRGVV